MSCPRSHGEQASNRIETKTPLCLWLHHTSWILFILQTVGSQMKAWEHCVNSCPYKVGHKGKGLDGSQIQMKGSWSKEQIAKDPRYLKVVTQTAQFFLGGGSSERHVSQRVQGSPQCLIFPCGHWDPRECACYIIPGSGPQISKHLSKKSHQLDHRWHEKKLQPGLF